ncbi:MAG: hypothetical protein Q8S13_12390 [Dehalococcoidia bacterium]|nr:hypothetical protein [Dehalococcoidia bacterium]
MERLRQRVDEVEKEASTLADDAERAEGIVRGWPPAPGAPDPGEAEEVLPQRANGVGDE